jgi:hypothetical protein
MKRVILVLLICLAGLSSRVFTFQEKHPDKDELFELRNMQSLKPSAIFKRDTFYGDHTSFPGEYLIHYIPMRVLNLFEKPADLSYEDGKIAGITKKDFWILASPKIVLTLLSLYLFYLFCRPLSLLGICAAFSILCFNPVLIYHAFMLRPYGILPELAIINLYLGSRYNNSFWFNFLYGLVIVFTCVNHAYGILIAGLPLFMTTSLRPKQVYFWSLIAMICWVHYASYNTFGIHPNAVQSVVDPFKFTTRVNFFYNLSFPFIAGSSAFLPFVLLALPRAGAKRFFWLLGMLGIPLLLIILIDIKTSYWILPRQYCWLFPYFAFWSGSAISLIGKENYDPWN